MASRSRFYVDTPRDPSQRHSMFVTHSELAQRQDLSSNSSSATLPSAAGSVDRLTGLEEKKSPRFFTLKPKTSFSLRPFFRSTSSLVSLSPGKRRKTVLERRDSYSQTEESRPEFGEVGVQTLNASTVDVPVQTCLEAWEEGDSYGHRRFAYASARTSPFWSRPSVASSTLSNSLISKNVAKDPLASPKLVKYAAPGDSEKPALRHQSSVSPVDVNSCQSTLPPSQTASHTSPIVPVKYFAAKELAGNTISLSANPGSQSVTKPQSVLLSSDSKQNLNSVSSNLKTNLKDGETNVCESEILSPKGFNLVEYKVPEVSNDLKYSVSQNIERPVSALKTEGTDSPSRRSKTVHFNLSESPKQLKHDPLKPRNVDKDFEALLKDLNVLTEDGSDLPVPLEPVSRDKCPSSSLLSPSLRSALDSLREDFLAPIPENVSESEECTKNLEVSYSLKVDEDSISDNKSELINVISSPIESKERLTASVSELENQNRLEESENNSVKTSFAVSTYTKSISNPETDSLEGNVYDNLIKEENLLKTDLELIIESKEPVSASVSEYENQNKVTENKNDFVEPTSFSLFTSSKSVSNPETDSLEGNVYDNVIKEENLVKTVPLPILPSFFEPLPQSHSPKTAEIVEYVNSDIAEFPSDSQPQSNMPLETEFDRNRLSRSSSRSSMRSNSKQGDTFLEPVNRFDSCENLDQLEEEIIRSLYSPDDDKLDDNIMKSIDLPPSESFQNSGTTATHMRRVILDQLLSGKNVEDIVPNYPVYQRAHSVPESGGKFKSPVKYTAILTKIDHEGYENPSAEPFGNSVNSAVNSSDLHSNAKSPDIKENSNVLDSKNASLNVIDSPKKTSVFIFPEDSISNSVNHEKPTVEISTNSLQTKSPSILEVRRSSWTPQTTDDASSKKGNVTTDQEKTSDKKSGQCDFTNCLRPSKIQNSPFLAKINTRSMSPCSFSPTPPVQSSSYINISSTIKKNHSPAKTPEAAGECDYANCLKPSEVQNSLFTAELSEITSNKSTNSLRAGSPLTVRNHSPLPIRSSSLDNPSTTPTVEEKKISGDNSSEPVKHKSEFLITLRTATNHSSNAEVKPEATSNSDSFENPKNLDNMPSKVSTSDKSSSEPPDADLPPSKPDSVAISPPPPPPLPSNGLKSVVSAKNIISSSMETMIQDKKANLSPVEVPTDSRSVTPKTPVMIELELKLQNKNDSERRNSGDKTDDQCGTSTSDQGGIIINVGRCEPNFNGSSGYVSNINQNGNIGILSDERERNSTLPNEKNGSPLPGTTKLAFSPTTVVTDEPPPPGAVLLDKKVTVEGDKVHTDKFYAIPVKEVLKEKTSTTKFIPAPPKYEGIGPTEDGIPTGLRNSVKKENMHNWYKTMFKSLHKADSPNDSQEYIIGYTSEPETSRKDMTLRKKSSTLDNRVKHDANSNYNKQNYQPVTKSSIEVYNVRPRLIEDYEPGYSSVTDDDVILSRRYLPARNTVKPSYEFKNGYESDSNITKKREQPEGLTSEQQKMWYREVQKGGDIPQFGLNKAPPEKSKEPLVGPVPPPPLNYNGPSSYQAVRPLTLPENYSNQNGNGYCQQMNGAFEMQMRHAIHSEMQQRMSPSSNQLSPPNRTMMKSPSRSPDMKIPAQALFDFKAESPKEIPLRKGDTVLILRQLDKNWYEGEHKGVVGIFPITYVEIIPPEHASTPVKVKPEGLGRALYDFVAQTSIELTVRKGDTITLLRRVDANWFEGIFNSKKGIVPISYVQVLQEPIERSMVSPSQKSYITSPSLSQSSEKLQKPSSISPSAYSSSSTSPLPINQERRRLPNKKGVNLIEPVMYRALYSYTPQNSDELELQEGDSVYVVEMCDDGWYVGTSVRSGVFGIFPGNYVEKVY